jgi:hypothetical protein
MAISNCGRLFIKCRLSDRCGSERWDDNPAVDREQRRLNYLGLRSSPRHTYAISPTDTSLRAVAVQSCRGEEPTGRISGSMWLATGPMTRRHGESTSWMTGFRKIDALVGSLVVLARDPSLRPAAAGSSVNHVVFPGFHR